MKHSKMVFLALALASAAALAMGCSGPLGMIIGSGKVISKDFDYRDFSRVTVGNAFQVEFTQGDSYKVSISADDNLMTYVQVSKTGGTLKIGMQSGRGYGNSHLKAKITLPTLEGLELSGAATGALNGFKSNRALNVELSGASQLSGEIQSGNADFTLSGASKATLKGAAQDVKANVSGASTLDLEGFGLQNLNVNASGASTVTANIKGKLDVELSGASTLNYLGSPQLGKTNITGASNLRKK
jgi:hypothetical protein